MPSPISLHGFTPQNQTLKRPSANLLCQYSMPVEMYDSRFIDDSVLDVIVPQHSDHEVEDIIASTDTVEPVESGVFPRIPQRSLLYFDESISFYVVLRTSCCKELELRSLVARLAIVIEVHAVGSPRSSNGQDPPQQVLAPHSRDIIIWSAAVDTAEEPVIIIQQKDDHDASPCVYVIWKLSAVLHRPKIRLQSPIIVFQPSAILRDAKPAEYGLSEDPYLLGGVSTSINLLDSLKHDPVLRGFQPKLSALRLSRIGSISEDNDFNNHSLQVLPQRNFRAIPPLTARVRYFKSSAHGGKHALFASLDLETAPFSNHDIIITAMELNLSEGSAVALDSTPLKLPMPCRPKDNASFLFHLTQTPRRSELPNNPSLISTTLDIGIEATVIVSETCRPRIKMRWKTGVDFTMALDPSLGAPNQSSQHKQRLGIIPVTAPNDGAVTILDNEGRSAVEMANPGASQRTRSASGLGITITFTAPCVVRVGEPFHWDAFLVNRSDMPRRLAILVIPKRKRGDFKGHSSRPSNSSMGGRRDGGIAEHFIDENLLYAMQRNTGREPPQIVSLSTDIKIGPLNPGSCHNTYLTFLALTTGVLEIEAIRVIDVVSNEIIDIRDLPDIIATDWTARTVG